MRCFTTFLIFLFALSFQPQYANAEKPKSSGGPNSQVGMVDLSMGEKAKDPYKEGQKQAIEHIKKLVGMVNDLKAGKESKVEPLSDWAIHYLTGAYLFCTITKAVCPEVLDVIFETDLINSRISKQAECPNMLKFWHEWKNNDMENRQRFLVRVGNFSVTSAFTANKRPGYIKCKETIDGELKSPKSESDYLRERYGDSDTSKASSFKKALELIEALEKNVDDVFVALDRMQK